MAAKTNELTGASILETLQEMFFLRVLFLILSTKPAAHFLNKKCLLHIINPSPDDFFLNEITKAWKDKYSSILCGG
ncbi:hypothetical protein MM300_07940 [Evansella sp. LMS18]|jgi:hypothetical protein|uniref:hypothetical protein n=1 Tax=Evansella sp. LMS18 TaxID=2924033 RepID=UPI0020D1AC70|nr:hypothetical protein [Evansella sp. LMS18]UTR12208.1 hypothetical protein MM300_07940 [Evansella sp. LMS18]